ncbi:type II secretion system F family protein [Patescibacteria group bacterium]|nr:type II secretion system F family protein [Patescibacteria group bacterium]
MKQFTYRIRKPDGVIATGVIESVSPQTAARTLQERKYLVLNIAEKRSWDINSILGSFGQKASSREIAQFTRLLATMLSTGLPLTDALSNLVSQAKNGYFREVLQTIMHDVQGGVALSEAMNRHPKVFNDLYVNLVKAGEASGKVDEALAKLADTLESNLDFQSKVKGAMIYPAVVTVAMTGIGFFMITNIIPQIANVYKEFGADLPLPTRILIGIANFITNYTIIVAAIIGLIYYTFRTLKKNPSSEYLINNFFFKIPIFGPLSWEVNLAVVCRTLGTLLASGVAILDALRIVSKTVGNNSLRSGLVEAAAMVEKGLPLSLALRRNENFPIMMSQLIAIGEETGTLDKSLERLSKFYQDSAEVKVKALTTLLEPIMILLMGGMVAGLALAVLLPMFNLVNVIK